MSEAETSSRVPKRGLILAIGFLFLMAGGAASYWYFFMRGYVFSDDARFDGELVNLAPDIGARIDMIAVDEGDQVTRGQILFSLDKRMFQASMDQAEAAVVSAQAALDAATAGFAKAEHGSRFQDIRIAESDVTRLEAEVKLAGSSLEREKYLIESGASTPVRLEEVQTSHDAKSAALDAARNRLKLAREGTRSEDRSAAEAQVAMARSHLEEARAAARKVRVNLGYSDVTAPFDGLVVRRWVEPSAMVGPGTTVLTLFRPSSLYVSANIDEKSLRDISIGDDADVSVDAYPDLSLHGHVEKIVRVTNSTFSLIPAEGVSGAFVKVSQRVPVRIVLDEIPEQNLGPGLSVEVRIHSSRFATDHKVADNGR